MDWIRDIDIEDLLDRDMALVVQECGLDVAIALWKHLSGVNIYVSEKCLFAARARYIRKHHDACLKNNIPIDVKELAVKLKVSKKFVERAIGTTDVKDDRQQRLI